MNRLMSYVAFRRGMGLIAILVFVTIGLVAVPQAVAADNSITSTSKASGDQSVSKAPGDNDGITGSKYKFTAGPDGSGDRGFSGLHGGTEDVSETSYIVIFNWRLFLLNLTSISIAKSMER
jgi:hypothetical protein